MSALRSKAVLARLASLVLAGLLTGSRAYGQGSPCTPTAETFDAWKLHTMCLSSRVEVPRALRALGVAAQSERGKELGDRLRRYAMPQAQDEFLKGRAAYDAEKSPANRTRILRRESERALKVVRAGLDELVKSERSIARRDAPLAKRLEAAQKDDSAGPGAPGAGAGGNPAAPASPAPSVAPSAASSGQAAATTAAGAGVVNDSAGRGAPGAAAGGNSAGRDAPGAAAGGTSKKEGEGKDVVGLVGGAGRATGRFFGRLGRMIAGKGEHKPAAPAPAPAAAAGKAPAAAPSPAPAAGVSAPAGTPPASAGAPASSARPGSAAAPSASARPPVLPSIPVTQGLPAELVASLPSAPLPQPPPGYTASPVASQPAPLESKPLPLAPLATPVTSGGPLRLTPPPAAFTNPPPVVHGPLPKGAQAYEPLLTRFSKEYGVDANLAGVIVSHESNWNPNARSRAGAMGLGQLTPATAKALGVANAYDPEQNLRGTFKLLKELQDRYGKDRLDLVLADYNAGIVAVRRYNGVPPYRETENYVTKIMRALGLEWSR